MNFFSRATTTALTGLAAFGFASAAFAHHVPIQPWVESEVGHLIDTAHAVGIGTYAGVGPCEERKGMMGLMYEKGYLLVCPEAHKGNADELADTIRHELIHAAQYCLSRDVIHPEHEDQYISDAQEHLHWNILGYEPSDWGAEAEARVLANTLDEKDVAEVLRQACTDHVWPKDIPGAN